MTDKKEKIVIIATIDEADRILTEMKGTACKIEKVEDYGYTKMAKKLVANCDNPDAEKKLINTLNMRVIPAKAYSRTAPVKNPSGIIKWYREGWGGYTD